jgi:hypothetical protein
VYDKNHTLLEFNKNLASKELDTFKKRLIQLKLINTKFIFKANLFYFYDKQKQLMPFHKYYSFFHGICCSETLSEDLKLAFNPLPFAIGIMGIGISWTAVTRRPPVPFITLHNNGPTSAASPSYTTSLKTSISLKASMRSNRNPHVLSAAKQPFVQTLWGFEDQSEPVKVDIVKIGGGFVEIRNKTYAYQRVMVNGQPCFSTLGISGRYGDMTDIAAELKAELMNLLPDYQDIMDVISQLTGDKIISFDHTAISSIRKIFNIKKDDAYGFGVPGVVTNGLRTNTTLGLLAYSEYDMRPDPLYVILGQGSPFNGTYTLRQLYEKALQMNFDMWLKRIQVQMPEMFPFVQFFRTPLYNGYLACMDHDLSLMNDFLRGFNLTVDDPESVLVFQHEALIHSKLDDIAQLRDLLYNKHETAETQIITKPHAIEVFLRSAVFKHQLGCSFEHLSSNKEFLKHAEGQKIKLVRETRSVVQGCLDIYRNTEGSDVEIARIKTFLANFEQEIAMLNLFSPQQCQYIINTKIKIGYFYRTTERNGRICDYTVKTAKKSAKRNNEDVSLYVQDNKDFLQPVESVQTDDARNIYAALDKCDPNNLLEQLKVRETILSKPVLEKTIINLHYHGKKHKYTGLQVHNPDADIQAWIERTLSPETIAILTEQTNINKLNLAAKEALKARPIDHFDTDTLEFLNSDDATQSATEDDRSPADRAAENWKKLADLARQAQWKAEQFSAPPYPVPDPEQPSAPPYPVPDPEQGAAQDVQQGAAQDVQQGAVAQDVQQDDEQPPGEIPA